jgi:hypothetical protein
MGTWMGLRWPVMEISKALADLGVFPIRNILVHLESAQDVLTSLIMERLWEEHASSASP